MKIFRNIRQALLEENKTTRYLKYAVGEIILVVIGILIALQINNWNEERKEGIVEKNLLSNLREEFEDNLTDLDSTAIQVDLVIASLERVFDLFSKDQMKSGTDSINIWLSGALQSPNWKPSEYLLNGLNNSGNVSILKSERLKLLLYKWSRQQKEMLEVQQRAEKTGEEIIGYIKTYGSLRNVDVNNAAFNYAPSAIFKNNAVLMSDYRFENYIDDKLFMYKINKRWLNTARTLILEIIEETKK
ncbi:MAG: hypothetical protein KDC49_14380 [Saprospiraceae bacterium]|nr:hypothetical protein [Saprospiraceae bacterium]